MMNDNQYMLGTIEASEQLITDLYIELRRKVNFWAQLTHQTAQARMGYVGQHLVSAVTGFPGGRSGARGYDLVISDDEYGEIKTCYRVDQLGRCNDCGSEVAGIEEVCPVCESENIDRKEDSKWLISTRNEHEFASIVSPKFYYLVLFDFIDIEQPDRIQASIWRVNPRNLGFAYCMIDYYYNIRANSNSKAPFNLWPYQLKFYLMRPLLIYRAVIASDDSIDTLVFPGRDDPIEDTVFPLDAHWRSRNLTRNKIVSIGCALGAFEDDTPGTKSQLLRRLEEFALQEGITAGRLADALARGLYWTDIASYMPTLPTPLRNQIDEYAAP